MADKKTELMAQFYAECQKKGYTDMTDDTQSLKAKVIATDLKLNYGNIVSFYEKTKSCYEQVQKEKAEAERLRAIQQQKEAQEQARRQVDGELLATLSDRAYDSDDTTSVHVYIRPDNSIYSTFNNGSKIEGAPKINIKQGGVLLLTYHPSQAVYTGATVGGITTGGVHYTQSGYTASKTYSGKGDIEISIGGSSFTLRLVKMSGHTCNLFKRDGQFTSLVHNREIKCYVESDMANLCYDRIKTGRLDHQTMMNTLSMAADEQRLTYAMCERITHLLGRVVHGQFPPSDEQIYDSAKALENASTSAELNRAFEFFRSISDYKDAATRAQAVKRRYEDILQSEKEQAVLEKEARSKRNKKISIAAMVVIVLVAVVIGAYSVSAANKAKAGAYENALTLMAAEKYEEAIQTFTELGNYEDSVEQIHFAEEMLAQIKHEEELETTYIKALSFLSFDNSEDDATAYTIFQELGDYKDSVSYLEDFQYKLLMSRCHVSIQDISYVYDSYGRVAEEWHDQNTVYKYAYYDDGTYSIEYRIGDDLLSTSTYNNRGDKTHVIGSILSEELVYEWEYAEDGMSKTRKVIRNGQVIQTRVFPLDENGNSLVDESWFKYMFTYDDYGRIIRAEKYWNDEFRGYTTYAYDEYGNIVMEELGNAEGIQDKYAYELTYGYVYCPDAE